ncbi:MAG TPA: helix-turn-helix transcriptional regulator [Fimbriimonas sp.]
MYTLEDFRESWVRAEANDQYVDLNFDCGASPAGFKRTDAVATHHVRVENISGLVAKTAVGVSNVPGGMNALCINYKGTLIARSGPQSRLVLIPPRSITYVRSARVILQAARGDHQSLLLTWHSNITGLLNHWIETRQGARSGAATTRSIACKPIDPYFKPTLTRLDDALNGSADTMEPLIVSFLYETVSRLMSSLDQVQLAAVPADLPETIQALVLRVRTNPALAWPLKEAADAAGYSPFHFSRVFKNLVGYGFHEYVDRCRTECAVEMLCTTDHAVDLIASTCGFGTTQGLRESVKEYLGLVPSELRSIPDVVDFND